MKGKTQKQKPLRQGEEQVKINGKILTGKIRVPGNEVLVF